MGKPVEASVYMELLINIRIPKGLSTFGGGCYLPVASDKTPTETVAENWGEEPQQGEKFEETKIGEHVKICEASKKVLLVLGNSKSCEATRALREYQPKSE